MASKKRKDPEREKAIDAIREQLWRLGMTYMESREHIRYLACDPAARLREVEKVLSNIPSDWRYRNMKRTLAVAPAHEGQ